MAELLIFNGTNRHKNTVMDSACCYKQGDIIHVAADGFRWGRSECLPKFHIVRLLQSLKSAVKFCQPLYWPTRQLMIKHPETGQDYFYQSEPVVRIARRYRINTALIPQDNLTITVDMIMDKSLWL